MFTFAPCDVASRSPPDRRLIADHALVQGTPHMNVSRRTLLRASAAGAVGLVAAPKPGALVAFVDDYRRSQRCPLMQIPPGAPGRCALMPAPPGPVRPVAGAARRVGAVAVSALAGPH